MKVKIKKTHKEAVIPKYGSAGAAGLDFTAVSKEETPLYIEYGLGVSLEIPEGHAGFLFPRSSVSKYHLSLANCVGVIDADFRGEVKARFKKTLDMPHANVYNIGDKVAQLIIMPVPKIEFEEVEDLDNTERGAGGFGSTGV